MTVQAQNSVQYYNGPIEIGTELSIVEFTFIDNSHVSAKVRGNTEVWQYGYDYTVSGAQTLIRTITVQRRVAENEVLAVYLDVPITQNISPEEGGNFPASTNEYVLDKLTHISQMLDERVKRSLQISIDTPFSGTLPAPEPNKALKISSDGNSFVMSDYDPDTALALTEDFKNQAQQAAIEALSSQTAAANSENNAKSSETIASQKANQVSNIYEQAVPELTSIIDNGVITLSNASNALRTTQITNCILEIPQRINLELNNGTLTLKAGSEVIVPNGFEADGVTKKFDYVTILQDEILNALPWEIGEFFVVHGFSANALIISFVSSDIAPQPINGHWWYDTGSNKIKTADGTSWSEAGCSLPIGIVNSSDGASVTSVDQVFNGIGYIGSTVWVDKGVKGLIPSGRNEDETLKNIEFTTNKVITRTFANTVNCDCDFLINATNIYYGVKRDNIYYYDSDKNYNISNGSVISGAVIGFGSIVNGSISLKVNHVFRAVAHNDLTKAVDNLLNKQQITNCILEIPQRIKIELNNGALTLKAGSEVIIPNGFEADGVTPKFNYVTIEEDTSNNFSWMTRPGLLTWRPNNSYFDAVIVDNQFSGDSTPASPREGIVWYDTTTNKVTFRVPPR